MNPHADAVGYLSAFLGGLVVSFSPCVYPLLPITLSFIGVEARDSRLRAFTLSLVYVLGIAVVYSALGIVAALTGSLFGQWAAHPLSYLVLGTTCILAALSFLDVFHLRLGVGLHNKVKHKSEYVAAFLIGAASGLIAGPCTAPVLGTILVYVAKKQNVLYGASLLFVFAYGMGTVLVLAGTFGGFITHFARSEKLLTIIKKAGGIALIIIGEYFIFEAGRRMP
jgi:thiol:disulfide interchange protein DsbD